MQIQMQQCENFTPSCGLPNYYITCSIFLQRRDAQLAVEETAKEFFLSFKGHHLVL